MSHFRDSVLIFLWMLDFWLAPMLSIRLSPKTFSQKPLFALIYGWVCFSFLAKEINSRMNIGVDSSFGSLIIQFRFTFGPKLPRGFQKYGEKRLYHSDF